MNLALEYRIHITKTHVLGHYNCPLHCIQNNQMVYLKDQVNFWISEFKKSNQTKNLKKFVNEWCMYPLPYISFTSEIVFLLSENKLTF